MKSLLLMALLAAPCLFPAHAPADDLARQGREVLQRHGHAVVTVRLVLENKFSMPGMSADATEVRQEATGTLIGPDGLTVMSLSTTDPDTLFSTMMAGMNTAEDGFSLNMKSELTDARLLLPDNTELPAEVVLRDKDWDLLFLRPKSRPEADLPHVDLGAAGEAEPLDQVISLSRLGRVAGRAYAAAVERISAVTDKPRRLYFPDSTKTTTSLGSPAFLPDGRVLGIFVMRAVQGGSTAINFFSGEVDHVANVILPAADIRKVAEQVPAWKE